MDFLTKKAYKLTQINPSTIYSSFEPLIMRGEEVLSAYQTHEDYIVFTNRRIISIALERDEDTNSTFFTLPYSRILYFSIESMNLLECNCVLTINFFNLGNIEYEFVGSHNVARLSHIIGANIFNYN